MNRVEQIGDATLYLGDCRAILPTLGRVDAVVTDPPYGLGDWNNRGTNRSRPFNSNETQLWDRPIAAEDIALLMSVSRHQIIWGANYIGGMPRTKQMLVWNKGIRHMHFNDCEIAWCSQWKEASRVFDLSPSSAEKKLHQTQKPLALMVWCLSHLPPDTLSICDPFMGSGTTGVACARRGRRFIGIEICEKYFDIACKRIDEAQRQGRLFDPPAPKPEQLTLVEGR